ncbi:hypothetical protein DV735_g3510, partial [Chaetothyriales sp. CBS 134920]
MHKLQDNRREMHTYPPPTAPTRKARQTRSSQDTTAIFARGRAQSNAAPGEDPASQSGVAGPTPAVVQSAEDLQVLNPQIDAPGLPSPESWSLGLSGDFVVDLMDHQTLDPSSVPVLFPGNIDQDEFDTAMANSGAGSVDDQRALRLLWTDSFLNPPSPIWLPRDTVSTRKLCEAYLQNVDPIIKILHRPTVSRWISDEDSPVAELPVGDRPTRVLEWAVCYVATTTMTEVQCQSEFQKSKAEMSATYRKLCEDAIGEAGLLTTRDMTVLQAFVLYLVSTPQLFSPQNTPLSFVVLTAFYLQVGRKSEDKGTAFWALVALAVRLTSAMKLNNAPDDRPESFFQQQMRLRLWLTVCLMDLQASLAESSEPLISYREAASALPYVRNINDADFNINTAHPVDSSEALTDTTFALVTYRMQVISRLLNFPTSEPGPLAADITSWVSGISSDDCTIMDTVSTLPPLGSDRRRQLVRQFKQEVFGLLHYCDPESSPYAWFTWHYTHCIVAAIRLSELQPLQCSPNIGQCQPPLPLHLRRPGGHTLGVAHHRKLFSAVSAVSGVV